MEPSVIRLSTYSGKSMRWMLYIAIGFLVLNLTFLAFILISDSEFKSTYALNAGMGFILLLQYVNFAKQERTNFIEFGERVLVYQTTTAFKQKRVEISYADIAQINLGMQEVEVLKQNNERIAIPISTSHYTQRIAFKHQFELLKTQLGV